MKIYCSNFVKIYKNNYLKNTNKKPIFEYYII